MEECPQCQQIEKTKILLSNLDKDAMAKLRRRVEDHLRKTPASLLTVAALLASTGSIKTDDLI